MVLQFEGGEVFQGTVVRVGNTNRWRCVAVTPGAYVAKVSVGGTVLKTASFTVKERPAPSSGGTPGFVPPREDYARTYLLLPPGAGDDWLRAVLDGGVWNKYHWTIGGSADDAGVGPTTRKVIAVNPQNWPGDLRAFFDRYYPGVDYVAIVARTPADLQRVLSTM